MNTSIQRHQFSYSCGDESVCVSTTAIRMTDLIQKFEDYLRACGFVIQADEHLEFAKDNPSPFGDEIQPVCPPDLEPTEDGKEAT